MGRMTKTKKRCLASEKGADTRNHHLLQKSDAGLLASFHDIVRPDGTVNFTDVGLSEEEHADSGLADSASDRQRKSVLQDCLLEGKRRALGTTHFVELLAKGISVDSDSHGRKFQRDVQNGVVDQNVRVELPVVVVGGAAVVGLSGRSASGIQRLCRGRSDTRALSAFCRGRELPARSW